MSDQSQQNLQQAYSLIKAGNKQEAARLLINILKTERDNAEAWWLLANASPDRVKARQALQQVLRIRPDHAAARNMLDKLDVDASNAPSASSSSTSSSSAANDPFAAPPSSAKASSSASASDPFGASNDPFGSSSTPSWANDPFGSSSQSRSNEPQNDPFGDPFASSPGRPSAGAPQNDPFGDPFASTSSRTTGDSFGSGGGEARTPTIGADPFGDPFASAAPRSSSAGGDPFADDPFMQAAKPKRGADEDPFAGGAIFERASERREAYPPRQKKSGTNPIVIILAVIGLLAVVVCGAVLFLANNVMNQVSTMISDPNFMLTLAVSSNDPDAVQTLAALSGSNPSMIATLMAQTSAEIGSTVEGEVTEKGAIVANQPIRAVLEDDGNHGYKFQGSAGQRVIIELTSTRGDFDTVLTLLGAGDQVIAYNDDVESGNLNSRLETVLPTAGAFTIVVGNFGFEGGEYELVLR